MPQSASGDLPQLSAPSRQLGALALLTTSEMSRVPATLPGGDCELSPSARHGLLCQCLFHLRSSLLTFVCCWADYPSRREPRLYPRARLRGEESPRVSVGQARPRRYGVVLIHGLRCRWRHYSRQIGWLAHARRVIAVDIRGGAARTRYTRPGWSTADRRPISTGRHRSQWAQSRKVSDDT